MARPIPRRREPAISMSSGWVYASGRSMSVFFPEARHAIRDNRDTLCPPSMSRHGSLRLSFPAEPRRHRARLVSPSPARRGSAALTTPVQARFAKNRIKPPTRSPVAVPGACLAPARRVVAEGGTDVRRGAEVAFMVRPSFGSMLGGFGKVLSHAIDAHSHKLASELFLRRHGLARRGGL